VDVRRTRCRGCWEVSGRVLQVDGDTLLTRVEGSMETTYLRVFAVDRCAD